MHGEGASTPQNTAALAAAAAPPQAKAAVTAATAAKAAASPGQKLLSNLLVESLRAAPQLSKTQFFKVLMSHGIHS